MRFSRSFASSPYCAASPDGRLVATLSPSSITVRSTETLRTAATAKLPPELVGPVSTLAWSPSSSRLLVSAADQIQVFSVPDASFHAAIRNPAGSAGPPACVRFGARDTEILVCAAFGLKFVVFDLSTSKAVEISSPKFHHPSSASRGFSLRPDAGHLALLTRVGGRDAVSVHHPVTRQVHRSWFPETLDAGALAWSPDGRWLLLWESPAHGHRLLLYTPDGQLFRALGASHFSADPDAGLHPGIRLCQLSPNSKLCAVCDHSRSVSVLGTASWSEEVRLLHPSTIVPRDTLQVWQEQLHATPEGRPNHAFLRAMQPVSAPGVQVDSRAAADIKTGCSLAAFDASSALLATRTDDSPSTLWIWDVPAAELRAVLIFHSGVSFSWHPSVRELLLVTSQEDAYKGLAFVWDPLSSGPTAIPFGKHLPKEEVVGKTQATWIDWSGEAPGLLLSDSQSYVLLSLADSEHGPDPWLELDGAELDTRSGQTGHSSVQDGVRPVDLGPLAEDDPSMLDDTFSFKHV